MLMLSRNSIEEGEVRGTFTKEVTLGDDVTQHNQVFSDHPHIETKQL